jgi:hypothetical protein
MSTQASPRVGTADLDTHNDVHPSGRQPRPVHRRPWRPQRQPLERMDHARPPIALVIVACVFLAFWWLGMAAVALLVLG